MIKMKYKLSNRSNYGSIRQTSNIRYIVIHYTGNDGDTDEGNSIYFLNNVLKTSAHYFVDSDSVTQTVPDNYIAYHCGAKAYKHKECRNSNSIAIELCDDVKNGVIYPSEKTIQNALELTNTLMKKYNIPKENIIRHYDVTGKKCPVYWVNNTKWYNEFWCKCGKGVNMEKPMIYNYIDKNMPEAYKPTIQKLVNKGLLKGTDTGLNLSDDMCRIFVILDRAKIFD